MASAKDRMEVIQMHQNKSSGGKIADNAACSFEGELIDIIEAARMCGMSKSMYKKLFSMEQTPEGIKLGRLRRWRRTEILAWINAGCPNREKWLVVRKDYYKIK